MPKLTPRAGELEIIGSGDDAMYDRVAVLEEEGQPDLTSRRDRVKKARRESLVAAIATSREGSIESAVEAKSRDVEAFSEYIRNISGAFWLSIVLGGFVAPYGGKRAAILWRNFYVVAMLVCGSTCLANCFVFKHPPFHVLPVDLMVAAVHIPGFYSLFFWSKAFGEEESPLWNLLDQLESDSQREMLKTCLGVGGPLLIPAQVATILIVYAGYSVPSQLFLNNHEDADFLAYIHCYSMWAVIPSVVACVVANAAFFSFFVYGCVVRAEDALILMYTKEHALLSSTSGHVLSTMQADIRSRSSRRTHISQALINTEVQKDVPNWDMIYEEFVSTTTDAVLEVQEEIDDVCSYWSSLVALFLGIAFLEILSVLYDAIQIYIGRRTYQLDIWMYCIDAFLAISGLGIMFGFLVMGAMLTERMDELCGEAVQVLRVVNTPVTIIG